MGILSSYEPARTAVPLGGVDVMVRGLNIDDFAIILANHLPAVTKAAEQYRAHKDSVFTDTNLQRFILSSASEFPGLVSEVISIGADEPEARSKKLPLAFQMAAISTITKLTLEEAGGLGNLFGQLAKLVRAAVPELRGLAGKEQK